MTDLPEPPRAELKHRLELAEAALTAIREGQVDTIIGSRQNLVVRLAASEVRESHLKKMLMVIRDVNQLIVAARDPQRLIEQVCNSLTGSLGYFSTWIALLDETARTVTMTAATGTGDQFGIMQERLRRGEFEACMCMQRALTTIEPVVVEEPARECSGCLLVTTCSGHTGLIRRLEFEGRVYGVLAVLLPARFARDAEEQVLFSQLAHDLAFGLHKIETEKQLRLQHRIIQTLPQPMALISKSYRYLAANAAYAELYHVAQDQIVGRRVADVCGPAVFERDLKPHLERCLAGASVYYEMQENLPAQGSRWMAKAYFPYRDEGGLIEGVVSHDLDITQRRRLEEDSKQRELLLNKIFDVLPIGLWFADSSGKLYRGNPAGVKIWGAEPTVPMEEYGVFKARRLPSGQAIAPDDWALVHTIRKGIIVTDELLEIDAFDGVTRQILNYTAPVLDDDGRMLGAIVMNIDISDRLRSEAEREKLQEQLTQAQKMESVGRLAGGVAHDFNNMLSVITGHAELAYMKMDAGHPARADLEEITKAARRSANLTQQLLAFARKQMIVPRIIDLNEAVEGMLKMLRRLIGEDLDLLWLPGKHLWPVKMDPSQIDQILANLCVNSRDAITGVGKVTIETGAIMLEQACCDAHAEYAPGAYVLLAVSDNGCGMDRQTLDNLFEPFFTTKAVGKGTGLGLATVYGIVQQNKGFIHVDSAPGRGSTFKVYLPRHTVVAAQAQPHAAAPARGDEAILLVEDEPTLLTLIQAMLEKLGYTLLTANTPADAISLAQTHSGPIHLLLTDVIMPGMDGKELARRLKSAYPQLKCLFMSGYTADVIGHHGVLDPGVHFIQKPFVLHNLAARIRDALDTPDGNGS